MKPKLISILVASLFVASPLALAAEGGGADGANFKWSGSASLGVRHTNDNALDSSKLNEYRDLGSTALLTVFDVKGRGDEYYLNAFGENLGRDDMFLDLKGGQYGVFKYQLYDNELRHNFGSGAGARSPYSGIGTANLTAVFPSLNPNTWNSFDHSYRRRDLGGMFEISANSPWYFRAEANEVKRTGINVFAGAHCCSPGNGFVDLPAPIDYSAKNYSAEAGYSSKVGHVAINALYSKFDNGNDLLNWSNGFLGGTDTTRLAPDNSMWKWSANGNLRQLPGESTVSGRVTWSKLSNDIGVLPTMLSTGGINQLTGANSPNFHGEVVKKSASLALTSHPAKNLDTKFYWNWYREDNRSTQLVFNPPSGAAGGLLAGGAGPNCNATTTTAVGSPPSPCTPEPFNLKKYNVGFEAGYRLNPQNKISGGFDWYDIERERVDFIGTLDKKVFAEWKNSSLDTLTARLKYQYLDRRSDWRVDPAVIANNPIEQFVRRFDFANVRQDLFKVVLDITPAPFLDMGLEAIYKKNDYKDTVLGRTNDLRQEYYASLSYGDPKSFRGMIFGDIEFMDYDSTHRVGVCNPDPSTPPQAQTPAGLCVNGATVTGGLLQSTTYTWNAKNKDKSWQVGLGADWLPMERLTVKASAIYAETTGTVDFAALGGAVIPLPGLLPIGNFDNTKRTSLNLKATYRQSKQLEFTGGYAFERYRYSDIGYDGTRYVALANVNPAISATQAAYTTGQFAFQPYTANIFYLFATYKFQ